jgi:lipopolysaccharide assembly protein A
MTSEPSPGVQPSAGHAAAPGEPGQSGVTLPTHRVKRTRTGGVWVAAALFALILLLLLIFILENGHQVAISYLGAHGHLPLGVALLFAAVIGILLVVIPGTGRIIQLRIVARRHRHLDAQTMAPPAPPKDASPPAPQQERQIAQNKSDQVR